MERLINVITRNIEKNTCWCEFIADFRTPKNTVDFFPDTVIITDVNGTTQNTASKNNIFYVDTTKKLGSVGTKLIKMYITDLKPV